MNQPTPQTYEIIREDRNLFRSAMLEYIHGHIDEYDFQCAIASIDEKREQDILYDVMIEEVQYYLVVLEYCYENLAEPKFDHNNRIEPEDLALFERLADCLDSDLTCIPEDLHTALHKQLRLDIIIANNKLGEKRINRIIFWGFMTVLIVVMFMWGFGTFGD